MDPELYKAAMGCNIEVISRHRDQLCHQLTTRENTVLHVAAQFPHQTECAREILNLQPSLLLRVNTKGETALHIAARIGCENTVRELLDFPRTLNPEDPERADAVTKELLRKTNKEKDTALHEAVRNCHIGVVELLLDADPDLSYAAANSAGETPLYLAAERHYHEIVSAILRETRSNQASDGPKGRTALHAAVIAKCSSCVEKLLDEDQDLMKKRDSYGWTPLHFAARFNLVALVNQLLHRDKSIAYIVANEDDKMTALHIAAKWASFNAMQVFWQHCPDCWEMVNEKSRNVLHIAIENENDEVIKDLLKSSLPISNLFNEKDNDGNTPLHLLATSYTDVPELIRHYRAADKGAFNKKNQTPLDAMMSEDAYFNEDNIMELFKANAPSGYRDIVFEDKERTEKSRRLAKEAREKIDENSTKVFDTVILVAALVATVTFAASFTVPGGFDSSPGPDKGMAVLVGKAAFKAFVISNTIAVTFSISSLILLLFIAYHPSLSYIWYIKVSTRFALAMHFLFLSLAAMIVSLITGSFAVLATHMGLAAAICAIGSVGLVTFVASILQMSWGDITHVYVKIRKDPRYLRLVPKAVQLSIEFLAWGLQHYPNRKK